MMKHRVIISKGLKRNVAFVFTLFLIMNIAFVCRTEALTVTQTLSAPDNVVAVKHGDESIKLTWSKVNGAKGYEIYKERKSNCGYRKLKTQKGTTFIDKNVGKGNAGTYKIRAYKVQNWKKVYSKYSYTVNAKVYSKNSKSVNATKVRIYVNPGYERAYGIREYAGRERDIFISKVYAKKNGKNVKPMCKTVKWFSTDPEIATVDKKGRIQAGTKTGTCYIYARAHNGVRSNNFKVEVSDFAYEKIEIQYAPGVIQDLFNRYEKDIRDIASYYSKNPPPSNGSWSISYWDEDYITKGMIPNDEMIERVKTLVRESPYNTEVMVNQGRIRFEISTGGAYSGLSMDINIGYFTERAIGEHWYYDNLWKV